MHYTRINPEEFQGNLSRQKAIETLDAQWQAELDLRAVQALADNPHSKVGTRQLSKTKDVLSLAKKRGQKVQHVLVDRERLLESRRAWLDNRIAQLEAEHVAHVWFQENPELDTENADREENILQIEAALEVAISEYSALSDPDPDEK